MHASMLTEAPKPGQLFGWDAEWRGLVSFAADARPGATLGVVSGRREGQVPLRHAGVLNRMPRRAAHAGQLAGVMIPYSWILR